MEHGAWNIEHGVELIRFLKSDNHLVKPFYSEESLNFL